MKLKNEITHEILDPNTGEIIPVTTSKSYSIKTSGEEFYMTFIKSCSSLFNLNSNVDLKLIIKLCMIAEFNTGKVYLPTEVRNKICSDLNIVTQQLTNSLKSLKDKKLITGGKGVFMLNPIIFWKGTTDMRKSIIKDINISIRID